MASKRGSICDITNLVPTHMYTFIIKRRREAKRDLSEFHSHRHPQGIICSVGGPARERRMACGA